MKIWAVVDGEGRVVDSIVADVAFVSTLAAQITDPEVDSGVLDTDMRFYDVTDVDPRPSQGWTRSGNNRWVAPVLVEPDFSVE